MMYALVFKPDAAYRRDLYVDDESLPYGNDGWIYASNRLTPFTYDSLEQAQWSLDSYLLNWGHLKWEIVRAG